MKRLSCIALFGILVLSSTVLAQTPEPSALWPPDPNAIFAESVNWSAIEPDPVYPLDTDYRRTTIGVLDAATGLWRDYPYPMPDRSFSARMLPNGLVWVELHKGLYEIPFPGEAFLLDPETGIYRQPATVCEGKVLQAESGKGQWLAAYYDDAEAHAFLCHSETGEMRDTLPTNLTAWRFYPDPDMTHLVALGRGLQDEERFEVYAYRLSDDRLIQLGVFDEEGVTDLSVFDWLSDTQGVLRGWGDYRDWAAFMEFDINQPNSMKPSSYASGWNVDTFRIENPIRYISATVDEYVTSKAGLAPVGMPCTVSIYDATGEREQQIANDCIPILLERHTISPFYRHGNSLYFLTRTGSDATVSTLAHFDIELEILTELTYYPMEIENIVSVSPDERYVVVIMDNNGKLDAFWQGLEANGYMTDGAFVTIFDIQRQHLVYQSDLIGVYDSSQVTWLDNQTVVFAAEEIFRDIPVDKDGNVISYSPPASLYQVHLGNEIIAKSMTMAVDVASPSHRYGLQDRRTVIDLFTFEPLILFQDDVPETYSIKMWWDDENGDLIVSVSLPEDSSLSQKYRVTLPEHAIDREILK